MEDRLIKKLLSAAVQAVIALVVPVVIGVLCKKYGLDISFVIYSGLFGVMLAAKEFVFYTIDRMKFNGFCIWASVMGSAIGIWIGIFITR